MIDDPKNPDENTDNDWANQNTDNSDVDNEPYPDSPC